jgi:hypothetical protein
VVLPFSCFLLPAIGNSVRVLGCAQTSLDQFFCHVISDESAEKLDQTFKHEFKGLGGCGLASCHDGLPNAVDVRLRARVNLDLSQGREVGTRPGEGAGEESIAPVNANPPG